MELLQDTMKCEVCKEEAFKYKCPRCLVKTCSLPCVNKHKLQRHCNGVRDKSKHVKIKEFTDMDMLNDYRLLEDTCRKADSASRDSLKRKVNTPKYCHVMMKQARNKNIKLKILPMQFSRRKQNKTRYYHDSKEFMWCVEWIFPQCQAKHVTKVKESVVLSAALEQLLDPTKADPVLLQALKVYVAKCQQLPYNVKLFMKVEERPANSIRYHELDLEKTLLENLEGKVIIEHPTIHVVLPDKASQYKLENEQEAVSDEDIIFKTAETLNKDKGDTTEEMNCKLEGAIEETKPEPEGTTEETKSEPEGTTEETKPEPEGTTEDTKSEKSPIDTDINIGKEALTNIEIRNCNDEDREGTVEVILNDKREHTENNNGEEDGVTIKKRKVEDKETLNEEVLETEIV